MSSLLIDDHPLIFPPKLAAVVGLNEAIILQQVHYWVQLYKRTGDTHHRQDGEWWVWNTIREWQANFPFWSEHTVRRTLESLRSPYQAKRKDKKISRGPLLIAGRYNRAGYDRTLWYRIDYDELKRVERVVLANMPNPFVHFGQMDLAKMGRPIPETTTEITSSTAPLERNVSQEGDDDVSVKKDEDIAVARAKLLKAGIDPIVADELAQRHPLKLITYWIKESHKQKGLTNPAGYIVKRVRAGVMPEPEPEPELKRHRPVLGSVEVLTEDGEFLESEDLDEWLNSLEREDVAENS